MHGHNILPQKNYQQLFVCWRFPGTEKKLKGKKFANRYVLVFLDAKLIQRHTQSAENTGLATIDQKFIF